MTWPQPAAIAPRRATLPLAAVEMYLDARGLKAAYPDCVRVRGTGDATDVAIPKGRGLILSRSAGPGLTLEQHVAQPMITLRMIGEQRDYQDGEDFAAAVHAWMICPQVVMVGTVRALYIAPAGGEPAHILTDQSRRAHFSCSYIIPVASGL